jgi:hypothetical protein
MGERTQLDPEIRRHAAALTPMGCQVACICLHTKGPAMLPSSTAYGRSVEAIAIDQIQILTSIDQVTSALLA